MKRLLAMELLDQKASCPLFDVRSPGEFANGHIPGAHNLPLFSDEERARVGTLYKKRGQNEAFLEGLELIGPKMRQMVEKVQSFGSNTVLLHCWRGGMRSESVGWLLERAGLEVQILIGGYKAYRQTLLEDLAQPRKLVIVGGESGSGKTAILGALKKKGEQVIDLEHLAQHKGSAFGGIGQPEQPTTEQFHNDLHELWRKMDRQRLIWIEDESFNIGKVVLPETFWQQMRTAMMIQVQMPLDLRVNRLVREYGQQDSKALAQAITKIEKRLGGQWAKAALAHLAQNELAKVAEILLAYYDKSYQKVMEKRALRTRIVVHCPTDDPEQNAGLLIRAIENSQHQAITSR